MGNNLCYSKRPKKINIDNIDISDKLIKKMTNDEINNKLSIIRSEKWDNILFSILYGLGTIGGIVCVCFVPEPSIGISIFLMSGSFSYYIKCSVNHNDKINKYIEELERRGSYQFLLIYNILYHYNNNLHHL